LPSTAVDWNVGDPTTTSPTKRGLKLIKRGHWNPAKHPDDNLPDEEGTET
jgi:hypothetical protein